MLTKVQFIREIHNKIQINQKKHWKSVRNIHNIWKDKNIERVQNSQQETILKWNLIYDKL
jgi:hypothetical protein